MVPLIATIIVVFVGVLVICVALSRRRMDDPRGGPKDVYCRFHSSHLMVFITYTHKIFRLKVASEINGASTNTNQIFFDQKILLIFFFRFLELFSFRFDHLFDFLFNFVSVDDFFSVYFCCWNSFGLFFSSLFWIVYARMSLVGFILDFFTNIFSLCYRFSHTISSIFSLNSSMRMTK